MKRGERDGGEEERREREVERRRGEKKERKRGGKKDRRGEGCRAPITTLDDQLTSPAPDHSHDSVFQAKQSLKRKAAQAYLPTKFPCFKAVSGLCIEARAKLGCTLDSLGRMARRSKQQSNRHPSNPRNLEDLNIPADYILAHSGEDLMRMFISL
ncbi:hypothetical protein ACHWQZ_G000469 [Mnemiopsis leidyi]